MAHSNGTTNNQQPATPGTHQALWQEYTAAANLKAAWFAAHTGAALNGGTIMEGQYVTPSQVVFTGQVDYQAYNRVPWYAFTAPGRNGTRRTVWLYQLQGADGVPWVYTATY